MLSMRITKKRHMDWGIMPAGDLSMIKEEGSGAQSAIGKKDVGYILRFGNVNAIQR